MKVMSVFIDGSANDRDSLTVAAMVARKLNARLDVVHAAGAEVYVVADSVAMPEPDQQADDAAKAAFDQICGSLPNARWVRSEYRQAEAIRRHGFFNDMIVLERVAGDDGPDAESLNIALFETPAPVLVCPPVAPPTVGTSAAVVWSPTLQAAKAVRISLPLLHQAEEVTVLVDSSNEDADPAPLLEYLNAHEIRASVERFDGGALTARGRGRAILEATHGKADLLVMGAFGENMMSSLLGLGRTTQKIVTATRIPTLIHC
jgi:nucleotide-binding universal stress UspA family protein